MLPGRPRWTRPASPSNRNLPNNPAKLMPILGGLPPDAAVAFEAASGWGWLVELESEPHLVHPSRCKVIASARLKNDKVDAATLAQLLRALLRRRAALVRWSTSLKTTRNPYQGLWSRGSGSARSGSR